MSSRKGFSKRNSSSHSSSGDSSANEVIAPEEEFKVEEEAKDAYYKALCGSPLPSQDILIPNEAEGCFNEDFSFPAEVAEMSGLMNGCAHAESLVPPIEGRVRQLWDFIKVSEDTAEAGTGVGDEGAGVADGEVDKPASSFGISMSGFFDFEL
ncbi:hypothetical protein DY000_02016100 [Brassica cretica]|uniref:Uncharacterized protein n=1 Tax=Brassica cretica TaxID=69181 RepID=A0ABQ7CPP1_BRACR|nr:hypothetical protein DY000_02016100 [Brassica cretica]